MKHILNKQGITQFSRKQIASMLSATALNRGKRCRCGKGAGDHAGEEAETRQATM